MKKEIIYYSILILSIALLLFFETNWFQDNTGSISKVINVESFEKLDIDLDCNIYVSLGDEQKVVFEGPANYLNKVTTDLEDGVLKISCRKPGLLANWFNSAEENAGSVSVYVKLTNPDQLIVPKKGNLISSEAFQNHDLGPDETLSLNSGINKLIQFLGNQLGNIQLL